MAAILNFSKKSPAHLHMVGNVIVKVEFYVCEIVHGLSLCESLHFVLYTLSSYFALFFSCVKIEKLLKFKMAARSPFQKCLLPKVYQVIG